MTAGASLFQNRCQKLDRHAVHHLLQDSETEFAEHHKRNKNEANEQVTRQGTLQTSEKVYDKEALNGG